jgi:adenine-specific DNA-methyltransferase
MLKNNNNQPIDRAELVWPNKRKEVERMELPFQTIETINLPRGIRQEDLFSKGGQEGWKNRLIWGDNLLIIGSLLKEFAGKINLIYIDPPFATGDDFSFEVQIGDQEITKEPSALEVKAYRDTWGKGLQSYLQMS